MLRARRLAQRQGHSDVTSRKDELGRCRAQCLRDGSRRDELGRQWERTRIFGGILNRLLWLEQKLVAGLRQRGFEDKGLLCQG